MGAGGGIGLVGRAFGGMYARGGGTLNGDGIAGGHISTTAMGADGKEATVDLFNAAQFEKPGSPHSVVNASDGSQWYQMASGEGMGAFYQTPNFTGDISEAAQVAATFPDANDRKPPRRK